MKGEYYCPICHETKYTHSRGVIPHLKIHRTALDLLIRETGKNLEENMGQSKVKY